MLGVSRVSLCVCVADSSKFFPYKDRNKLFFTKSVRVCVRVRAVPCSLQFCQLGTKRAVV